MNFNFNQLYKKIADIDQAVNENCGMPPMDTTTPQTPPPSMSINMNAQGMENIESLMKLMTKVNPDMMPKVSEPLPSMTDPIIKIGMASSDDMNTDMDADKAGFANEPDEKYADIDAVTKDAGGGMNGPKHPKDLRVKDPSAFEKEAYENEPDENYEDHLKMIKHLAGGMNKEKTMVKHSYKQGDNPMAMPESEDPLAAIKNDLRARLREYKEN
jgi:hypothetical protein